MSSLVCVSVYKRLYMCICKRVWCHKKMSTANRCSIVSAHFHTKSLCSYLLTLRPRATHTFWQALRTICVLVVALANSRGCKALMLCLNEFLIALFTIEFVFYYYKLLTLPKSQLKCQGSMRLCEFMICVCVWVYEEVSWTTSGRGVFKQRIEFRYSGSRISILSKIFSYV